MVDLMNLFHSLKAKESNQFGFSTFMMFGLS